MLIYGTDNSYIEILNINQYTNDFILVSPNNFIQEENKIIKGISSFFFYLRLLGLWSYNNDIK